MPTSPRSQLVETIGRIGARGWCPATSGNFSLLLGERPRRLLMTPSGIEKSRVTEEGLIEVSDSGEVLAGSGELSAEFALHRVVYDLFAAGAVLHTHTVANTLLSRRCMADGALVIEGLELLKAFSGVKTHEHREIVPIFANSQQMQKLGSEVRDRLAGMPGCHGFLLTGHGLYTWGASLDEALRHLEAFEFLFEVCLRESSLVR